MSIEPCCLRGFSWDGKPCGTTGTLANNNTYITGSSSSVAILFIHDLFGWTFPNIRLLADHYAAEVGATVYVPDFFGGEVLPYEPIFLERWDEIDLVGFMERNGRHIREAEIFACARALKDRYAFVAAVGFCYGGWASFRLAAREHQPPLVDCISIGHPSLLTKSDIDQVAVPVQVLAPEHDAAYTAELKTYTFETCIKQGIPFVYQHFPGVEHSCFVRGDERKPHERKAMVQGKKAVVDWLRGFIDERASVGTVE